LRILPYDDSLFLIDPQINFGDKIMTAGGAEWYGFAYGEDVESPNGRSLGFRLLAPAGPEPWAAEVEALARRLQAAPYPDQWPATDLFCSVLLPDEGAGRPSGNGGRRLIALARYGLADHTPSQRRGGLELIGLVGPASVSVPTALTIYRWLQQRRAQTDELRALGGRFPLQDVLVSGGVVSGGDKEAGRPGDKEIRRMQQPSPSLPVSLSPGLPFSPSPLTTHQGPLPVLPIRIWQEGTLLFAATAPSDPDHRLSLLEQGPAENWQWLPLIGEDFPVQSFAQRGPVVAWTPHLAGVAVKLDRKPDGRPVIFGGRVRAFAGIVSVLLVLLLAGNLWALLSLVTGHGSFANQQRTSDQGQMTESQERLAAALLALILEQGNWPDSDQTQKQFIGQYDHLILRHPELRLREPNGKAAVGGVGVLLLQRKRNADQVKKLIEKALSDKEFNDKISKSIADKVYQQLLTETKD